MVVLRQVLWVFFDMPLRRAAGECGGEVMARASTKALARDLVLHAIDRIEVYDELYRRACLDARYETKGNYIDDYTEIWQA